MPSCELCGKEAPLLIADIEKVELKVCSGCGKWGNIRKQVSPAPPTRIIPKPEAPEFTIVDHFPSLLRSAREKRGMTQKEFARLLNEKESILAKWESGSLLPGVEDAKKLEKKLGLQLVQEEMVFSVPVQKTKEAEFTLGDVVRLRKR